MNINQLQYFQITCKYMNISKSAQELHVSQSAVSKAIKELEKEFEISLFSRYNNTLFLTADGKLFLEKTEQILNKVQLLYTFANEINDKSNTVRLGISPLVGGCLLPPFYQEVMDLDNKLILDPVELQTHKILSEIESENIDVGLIVSGDSNLSRFGCVRLLDTSLVFCVHENNPLSKENSISFSMLKDEPLIFITPDSSENKILLEHFQEENIIPNILFHSDQIYTIQHCINHELASSFLYDIVVPRNQYIKHVPLKDPVTMHICLVWKKDRYLHSGIKRLINISKNFTFCHYHG